MPRIFIRPARPSDGAEAQRIVFASLRAFGIEPEPDGLDADVMRFGREAIAGGAELVAESEGALLGVVALTPRRQGVGYVSKLFVDAEHRRRGIGRMLLDAAVAEARRAGHSRLELQTRSIFSDAVRLYETTGWKRGPDPHPIQGPDRTYFLQLDTIDFYFDYLSPFAYFGWKNATGLAARRGLKLELRPVVFGALLSHWGQLGPAEIPPKRLYTFKTCLRYAALNGIELRGPKTHPFRSLAALRISLESVAGARQADVVAALFEAVWAKGIDGGDPDALRAALDARGLDGRSLLAAADAPEVKDRLRADTDEAIRRGVFGVPTFFVGSELFWGNDSLEMVERALDGRDPLDPQAAFELVSRPRGVERPR